MRTTGFILWAAFRDARYPLCPPESLGVRANSKASLRRVITDKISARDVAEYLIAHPKKVTYQQEDSRPA